MADPLKHRLGSAQLRAMGERFARVHAAFDLERFVRAATRGLAPLELLERAAHAARALDRELPDDDAALAIFVRALGPPLEDGGTGSLAYFVHSTWLITRAAHADYDLAMSAACELTRRFTAELAVRPLIERDPERALAWLYAWSRSDDTHVRRLVSEGTRPRLPWAPRLTVYAGGYEPIIELLEALADDPSLYVRRSVANHIGDLAKDDLPLALRMCRGLLARGTSELEWVVRHGLRHPVKRGDPEALALFGFGHDVALSVSARVTPSRVPPGGVVQIDIELANPHADERAALVDLVVHYRRQDGGTKPKVFKLRTVTLAPGERTRFGKRLSLQERSTRRHYAGRHAISVQVNGREHPVGEFTLLTS